MFLLIAVCTRCCVSFRARPEVGAGASPGAGSGGCARRYTHASIPVKDAVLVQAVVLPSQAFRCPHTLLYVSLREVKDTLVSE